MFNFEKLNVYQQSIVYANLIYYVTKFWPKDEQFGLTNQIRRAAVSITLNIAEGSSRTKKDFCHFLDQARGSCYETVAAATIAKNLKYVGEKDYLQIYDSANSLAKMINALKNSLK